MYFAISRWSSRLITTKPCQIRHISQFSSFKIDNKQNYIINNYKSSNNLNPTPSFSIRQFSSAVDSLNKEQVQERVFTVLKAFDKVATGVPSFNAAASFTADLGLDSLDVVEVIMAVEEEFGIEIPDEAADEFKSPQEVIDYIYSKMH